VSKANRFIKNLKVDQLPSFNAALRGFDLSSATRVVPYPDEDSAEDAAFEAVLRGKKVACSHVDGAHVVYFFD
jgi:hypothetical protein